MSLQNILNPEAINQEWTKIYTNNIECKTINCNNMNMPNGGDLDAHNITVDGVLTCNDSAILGGVDYNTPDIGQPNYSLHTDGAGVAFWAPDDTGTSDISYSGTPPTVAGQLSRFSSTTGGNVDQSAIIDDGLNLNLNNQNISNVNLVDGVDISAFKTDYDNKVNQDVKILSNPTFNLVQGARMVIYDPITDSYTFDWRSDGGQLQLYNDTGNVQMRVDSNDTVEVVHKFLVFGLTTLAGGAQINFNTNSYNLPTTRPTVGQILGAQNSGGVMDWYSSISAPMGELQYGNGGVLNYNITLTNINQWYELGSVTSETLTTNNADFTLPKFQKGVGAGQLEYIGNKTSQFNISYSFSGSSGGAIRDYQMCLSINGVIINSSITDTDFVSNGAPSTFTANKMLLLGTNNYISILIRCTSSAGEIINVTNTNICALSSSLQLL